MTAPSQAEVGAGLLQQLSAVRERLLQLVVGVSEEQFKRRPAAPVTAEGPAWSIAEVLAHLLANERLQAQLIEAAMREDGAAVPQQDPAERLEAARRGRLSPVPQLIHGLLASRREIEGLLQRAVEQQALQRSVQPEGDGIETIEQMLSQRVIAHEAEHNAQIEALRREVGASVITDSETAP